MDKNKFGKRQNGKESKKSNLSEYSGKKYLMATKNLYDKFQPLLMNKLSDSVLLNEEDIKEKYQDTMEKVIEDISNPGKTILNIDSYVKTIFLNKIRHLYKKHYNKLPYERLSDWHYNMSNYKQQDEEELKSENIDTIFKIAEMYHTDCRKIIKLYYFEFEDEDTKHNEIAAKMGLSAGNSRAKLKRCLDFVRKYFKDENKTAI